jgi:CRISPR-associated endoribonuclease Cas6
MPSTWHWPLTSINPPDRRALHALLCRWLDIDHKAKIKPWRWSTHKQGPRHTIEISLLDDTLTPRLLAGHDAHRRRHGSSIGGLQQIVSTTWADLAAHRDRHTWTLHFTTPVTFRRGSRFLPWPAPAPVFGSLRTTWRTFAAPHVGDLDLDLALDPLVVTAIDGTSTTEQVILKDPPPGCGDRIEVTVTGFLGTVRYTVDGRINTAAVDTLTRLAPYAGIGAYTTRGFGAVQVALAHTAAASHQLVRAGG